MAATSAVTRWPRPSWDDPRLGRAAAEMLATVGPRGGARLLPAACRGDDQLQRDAGRGGGDPASLLSLGTGALALKQLTPGAIALGPALAAMLAQQAAVIGFPLGVGLGGLW